MSNEQPKRQKDPAALKRVFLVYRYAKQNDDLEKLIRGFFESPRKRPLGARWQVDVLSQTLPSGADLLAGVHRSIKNADLVIIIASEVTSNVAFELGMAYALDKDFILLVPQPSVLEMKDKFSDISGLKYSTYDPQSIMQLPELLEREVALLEERIHARVERMQTPEYLVSLGDQFRLNGLAAKALETYRAALSRDTDNVGCLVRMGQLYLEMYRLPEAESVLRRALKLDTDNNLALEILGQVLLDSGQYDKAVSDCHAKLIQMNPSQEANYFKITIALNEMGKPERAVAYLTDAIEKQGIKSAALYYDRAWSAARRLKVAAPPEKAEWRALVFQSLSEAVVRDPSFGMRALADQDFDELRGDKDFPLGKAWNAPRDPVGS